MTAQDTQPSVIGRGVDWSWIAVTLVVAILEVGLTAGLYVLPGAMFVPLVCGHLLVSAATGLWALRRWRRGRDHSLALVLAISVLFIGPVAPIMLLFVYPYFVYARRRSTPFEEWYRSLFPENHHRLPERIYEAIVRHEVPGRKTSSVVSFLDVIRHGSTQHKFAVIALIARHFRPAFAPILKIALKDPANEIRVQAATAMSRVTDDFARRMQTLEEEARHAPDGSRVLEELARTYDDYSFTGILDANHAHNARTRALDLWLKVVAARPDHTVAIVAVGRLLMRLGRYELAASWMERAMAENRASPQMMVWYMECLFRQDRLDELRVFAAARGRTLEGQRAIAPRAMAAVQLWQTAGDARQAAAPEAAHA